MKGKQLQPQVKHLRDLDLNSIEKPKTLVILHYSGRKISIPFFKQVFDFATLLYHHITTLEQKILSNDPDWQKKANQQIVCFHINKELTDKLTDGELKSDILLSLLRIQGQQAIPQLQFQADLTKIYKFLEVEPYYRMMQKQNGPYRQQIPRAPYFNFYRMVNSTNNSNTYIARRITDGYFFALRIYAEGSKVGLSESRVVEHLSYIDQQGSEIRCSLLVRSQQIVYIPHPEAQSQEEEENAESCKHIALIYPYFVRGSLQQLFHQAAFGRKRISQMDCLNYLKDLMWGAHLLHEKYNLIHRAIMPSNIFLDQNGQMKLSYFAYCVPCFDSQMNYSQYCPKTRYPKSGYSLQELLQQQNLDMGQYSAPELMRGQFYNYLVDFYSIGIIVKKLYELSQAMQRAPVSQNNQNLMIAMIQRLTSSDLEERAYVVREIIDDIAKEDLQGSNHMPPPTLTLQDIKVGRGIQVISSKKFIQNQENYNGIDHETVFNFFKKPIKAKPPKVKRQRKGSKEKLLAKNSRQKSQKCFSKASDNMHDTSQTKKRKISNTKNRSFNVSNPHETSKDSRDKRSSQKNAADSPAHRKKDKSRSQERKKNDPLACTKLYTHHDESKKAVIVPKSPKMGSTLPVRSKSPAMRQAKR